MCISSWTLVHKTHEVLRSGQDLKTAQELKTARPCSDPELGSFVTVCVLTYTPNNISNPGRGSKGAAPAFNLLKPPLRRSVSRGPGGIQRGEERRGGGSARVSEARADLNPAACRRAQRRNGAQRAGTPAGTSVTDEASGCLA